jgi:thiol-disulfide isomerase/thioredoxin
VNIHLKYTFVLFLLLGWYGFVFAQSNPTKVEVIKFDWYESLRNQPNDTTYIINFWATWCVPCVAELPHFEQITKKYQTQKVKVYLVSLDFRKNIDSHLRPFVKKKNLQSAVLLLDEPDANAWIDKVDPSWSGALPATIIFNNKKNMIQFLEKELNFTELDLITSKFLSK